MRPRCSLIDCSGRTVMGLFRKPPGRGFMGLFRETRSDRHGIVSIAPATGLHGIVSQPARKGDCMGLFRETLPAIAWGLFRSRAPMLMGLLQIRPFQGLPAPARAVWCSSSPGSRPGAIAGRRCPVARVPACLREWCRHTSADRATGTGPRPDGAASCTQRTRRAAAACALPARSEADRGRALRCRGLRIGRSRFSNRTATGRMPCTALRPACGLQDTDTCSAEGAPLSCCMPSV
jgi:hypothetical protein